MKEELQEFDINLEDIEESVYLFNNINEAVEKLKKATSKDRFEVVLNNNLIEAKDKYTWFRTILGCRVSYDNLDKNVSFIVREDTKPSYETLEKEIEGLNNIIKEAREYIQNHQLVFELSSKKQISNWFDMFYKQVLEILDKVGDEK